MLKNYQLLSITTILVTMLLTSCGGGDSTETVEKTPAKSFGAIVDSAVAGIRYSTETSSGFTDVSGQFPYVSGENITFSIGDIVLPTVPSQYTITPLDIYSTTDVNDTAVVNLSRLLQTLDTDGDSSNGIDISTNAHTAALSVSIDFSSVTFDTDVNTLVTTSGATNTVLVNITDAVTHLQETLDKLAVNDSSEAYFEVYGTTADDTSYTTSDSTYIGSSRSGNVFNIEGYERVKIYIPPSSGTVRVESLTLAKGGLSNSFITSESEPFYTSSMAYPLHMGCNLGDIDCPQANSWQYTASDGLYIRNKANDAAYMHFRTWIEDPNCCGVLNETADTITIGIEAACNNYAENYDTQSGDLLGYTCID